MRTKETIVAVKMNDDTIISVELQSGYTMSWESVCHDIVCGREYSILINGKETDLKLDISIPSSELEKINIMI